METKFYVGQRVRGLHGQVVIVLDPKHDASIFKGILVDGPIENQPIGYISSGWLKDSFVDFPIYPPRVVLTEWHKKQIASVLNRWVCADYSEEVALKSIEYILSEPEPPKYQPKQGEAVLVKVCKDYPWVTGVFSNMEYDAYKCYGVSPVNFCRPFDASLIGQVTND